MRECRERCNNNKRPAHAFVRSHVLERRDGLHSFPQPHLIRKHHIAVRVPTATQQYLMGTMAVRLHQVMIYKRPLQSAWNGAGGAQQEGLQ